jgi:hypothetical protein
MLVSNVVKHPAFPGRVRPNTTCLSTNFIFLGWATSGHSALAVNTFASVDFAAGGLRWLSWTGFLEPSAASFLATCPHLIHVASSGHSQGISPLLIKKSPESLLNIFLGPQLPVSLGHTAHDA